MNATDDTVGRPLVESEVVLGIVPPLVDRLVPIVAAHAIAVFADGSERPGVAICRLASCEPIPLVLLDPDAAVELARMILELVERGGR